MNVLISPINPNSRRPPRKELAEFINKTIKEINEISKFYEKLKLGEGETKPLVDQIESSYTKILASYSDLFELNPQGSTKVKELQDRIEEIKDYHKVLLEGPESIKIDIENSKSDINDFYTFLFGVPKNPDEEAKSNEDKVKIFINDIANFHKELTKEDGHKKVIEDMHKVLKDKYEDLFIGSEEEVSKIEKLEKNIKNSEDFQKKLTENIQPEIDSKQKYLNDLQKDIDIKRKEIGSLLINATLGTLGKGYEQSKIDYSKERKIKYKKFDNSKSSPLTLLLNLGIFIHNYILRNLAETANYLVFALPLIAISLLFILPLESFELFKDIFPPDTENHSYTVTQFLLFKTGVSLPLLWIAWFGQKNISIRRRLYEEYNHKERVTQMYVMFTTNPKQYPLDNQQRKILVDTLMKVIADNPAKYLGDGETMMDNVLEKLKSNAIYYNLKDSLIEDILKIIKKKDK